MISCQVYPQCVEWTTFAITSFIERLWDSQLPVLDKGLHVSPYIVELASVLERTLNVAHTGNVGVIATTLMDRLYVGRSLVDHGSPTFHDCIKMGLSPQDTLHVPDILWPRHPVTREPFTASRRSQIFNYGMDQWEVSRLPTSSLACGYRCAPTSVLSSFLTHDRI